ncbi:MAG TPA: 50S ribosomal protein L11 methyltransferase [Gemmatimonadales bacterium]|nr:50S ribosomal protein L11 methyltransferase [Gemmatimonadales bacterium]
MTWWAIDVRPDPSRREWMGAWLVARTGQAVEEREDGTLVTFAEDERAADALVAALEAEAAQAVETSRRPLDAIDWSTRWRDGLGARHFGRLTVAPSWVAPSAGTGPVVVLDPESAFGSGEHGSTRAALTLLERHLRPGDRVLDLGSGSGILAIAAVRLGAAAAVGIENDVEANPVARRNAERNGVASSAQFVDGDAGDLAPLLGPADLLLSNILRLVNVSLLPAIMTALRPGGLAIFSGMEEAEAPLFGPALEVAGFLVRDEVTDTGWWAVAAARP